MTPPRPWRMNGADWDSVPVDAEGREIDFTRPDVQDLVISAVNAFETGR